MEISQHKDLAVEFLRRMKLIRCVEETIAERYSEQKIRCPTHLSTGQECVAAATGLAVVDGDLSVSTHRAHAHYLGMGGDLNAMMAELYGKASGCAAGRGGSMHLTDPRVGFVGSTAIVGNSIPLGVGLALAHQVKQKPNVSIVFLGDAAVETGVFHESINFAAVMKLPVVFICENNNYSCYTPLHIRQPEGLKIHELAAVHTLRAEREDGNQGWAVYSLIKDAIEFSRAGKGPSFLEFISTRWRTHCGPYYDHERGYRSKEEWEDYVKQDAIARFEKELRGLGLVDDPMVHLMEKEIASQIDAAFDFADQSPYPDSKEAFTNLFAD